MAFVVTFPTLDLQSERGPIIWYIDDGVAMAIAPSSPEGIVLANAGSLFTTRNGQVWIKTTDNVNTGWQQLASGILDSPVTISGTNPTLIFSDTDGTDASIDNQNGLVTLTGNLTVTGDIVASGNLSVTGRPILIPEVLLASVTDVGNVLTGVDTLLSYSLPANTLKAAGDFILVQFGIAFANTANNKRIALTFNGNSLHPGNVLGLPGGPANWQNTSCDISIYIYRVTDVLVKAVFKMNSVGGAPFTSFVSMNQVSASDLDVNANILLLTGEAVATDDIQLRTASVVQYVQTA
jgi:hypothetical protein